MRAFLIRNVGLLIAASGVAIGSAIFLAGLHAVGMLFVCAIALSVANAWDEETQ